MGLVVIDWLAKVIQGVFRVGSTKEHPRYLQGFLLPRVVARMFRKSALYACWDVQLWLAYLVRFVSWLTWVGLTIQICGVRPFQNFNPLLENRIDFFMHPT